jgi:hypothetical protein
MAGAGPLSTPVLRPTRRGVDGGPAPAMTQLPRRTARGDSIISPQALSESHRPEPFVVFREEQGEAPAGDRAGWPSSRESALSRAPAVWRRQGYQTGRQHGSPRYRERRLGPAWSETPACMDAPCRGTGRSRCRPAVLRAIGPPRGRPKGRCLRFRSGPPVENQHQRGTATRGDFNGRPPSRCRAARSAESIQQGRLVKPHVRHTPDTVNAWLANARKMDPTSSTPRRKSEPGLASHATSGFRFVQRNGVAVVALKQPVQPGRQFRQVMPEHGRAERSAQSASILRSKLACVQNWHACQTATASQGNRVLKPAIGRMPGRHSGVIAEQSCRFNGFERFTTANAEHHGGAWRFEPAGTSRNDQPHHCPVIQPHRIAGPGYL